MLNWYSINTQARVTEEYNDPATLRVLSRIVFVAIARWLMSGIDCPDADATDGISDAELQTAESYDVQPLSPLREDL